MIKVNRALRIGSRINNSTSGEIIFTDALGKLNQDSAFFWDNVNKRLGIGTASPSSTIHLYEDDDKTGTDAGLTIEQDGTGDAILQFLLTAEKRWVIGIDNDDENKFKITRDGNLSTNGFLTIDNDGNVGIGTTSPQEKLHIDGNILLSPDKSIQMDLTRRLLFDNTNGPTLMGSVDVNFIIDSNNDRTTSKFVWAKNGFTMDTATELMVLNEDGNVGIGTASPLNKLHIKGADPVLYIQDTESTSGSAKSFIKFSESSAGGGTEATYRIGQDSRKFTIAFDTNDNDGVGDDYADLLTIDDNGNVGIGTTSPDEKLTIDNGTLLFQNDGGLCFGEIYAQDNTTETAITTAGKVNKVQITIFNTNGHSNNTSPDHTNGHITITKAGKYMVNISLSVESIAGDSDKLGFSLYKNNGTTEFPNIHFHRDFTSGAAKTGSASMNGIIDCAVNDTIELWGWNENDTDNFLIEDVTISLFQIGG